MSKSKSSRILRREFGHWLKQQREERGITQKFVAVKSNITTTQLSRIENGHSSTRRDTVIQLAQIIGIDEREALRHFAPESFPQIPKELENIPFSEFNEQELKEIADFITFKLSQKRREQAATESEPPRKNRDKTAGESPPETRFEILPEKDSDEITSYRLKNGQLVSEAETEAKTVKKGHTKKKPPE
jgi:transcriptional regulator with XRE-family HTH domain